MRLPIDTAGMTFMCATAPEAVLDYETKQPKTDENGELLYSLQVVALAEGGAEVVSVKVPGEPRVEPGQPLELGGLVATPWTMGDRNGVAFRAASIRSTSQAASKPAKGASDA